MRTVVFAMAAWCAAAAGPAAACGMGYVGEVPLRVVDSEMVAPITVNGITKDALIAFDALNETDLATAKAFRLEQMVNTGTSLSTYEVDSSTGENIEIKRMKARSVQLGAARAADVFFAVDINSKPDQHYLVIGGSTLAGYDIDFDLKGGRLIFYFTEEGCRGGVTMTGDLASVPIESVSYIPHFFAGVNGKDARATLSGSLVSRMTRHFASRLGLSPTDADGKQMVTATLDIAGVQLRNHRFALIDGMQHDAWRPDIFVGISLFQHTHVWVSASMRKLILQVPAQPSPPAPK